MSVHRFDKIFPPGDAILAQWVIAGMQASDVISLAVKCALKIQSKCGVQEMKYDCKLRVKIGAFLFISTCMLYCLCILCAKTYCT